MWHCLCAFLTLQNGHHLVTHSMAAQNTKMLFWKHEIYCPVLQLDQTFCEQDTKWWPQTICCGPRSYSSETFSPRNELCCQSWSALILFYSFVWVLWAVCVLLLLEDGVIFSGDNLYNVASKCWCFRQIQRFKGRGHTENTKWQRRFIAWSFWCIFWNFCAISIWFVDKTALIGCSD